MELKELAAHFFAYLVASGANFRVAFKELTDDSNLPPRTKWQKSGSGWIVVAMAEDEQEPPPKKTRKKRAPNGSKPKKPGRKPGGRKPGGKKRKPGAAKKSAKKAVVKNDESDQENELN